MKYITYLTIYTGEKLPPFYIGSTSLKKFNLGYHGTVTSKKYKDAYKEELSQNPELFDTCIIDEFDTREEATACELHYQKLHDAVKNENFFNMSYAAPKGCFGMDVAGKNHPLYGSHNGHGNIHSYHPETLEQSFLPYIPEGFVKGRSPNYKASSHNKGKKWYNNGIDNKMCCVGSEPDGWILGKIARNKGVFKMTDLYDPVINSRFTNFG
ncbi:homing endonuclease [Serratia phage vB_SspM_LC53]|nr:homing endonuclease [Serratia phage vB_SspM_LC53]